MALLDGDGQEAMLPRNRDLGPEIRGEVVLARPAVASSPAEDRSPRMAPPGRWSTGNAIGSRLCWRGQRAGTG
jgi:hypothetical protein